MELHTEGDIIEEIIQTMTFPVIIHLHTRESTRLRVYGVDSCTELSWALMFLIFEMMVRW